MALPKKNSRKIVVNDITYRYVVSGNDGYINLIIELEENNKQRLIVSFGYMEASYFLPGTTLPKTEITPATVEKVITRALKNGWKPNVKAKQLSISNSELLEKILS
ncbi:MAG: hypothetical protein IAF38_20570 [Bacteroidia bacterium]|nr:hypothetical protein [Bacteroidia bacterium]